MFVPSIAQAISRPSNDPNSLAVLAPFVAGNPNINYFPDWNNPNGKELVDLSTLSGKTLVLVVISQSNGTNVMPALYTPTNRIGVLNFNFCDGGTYRAPVGKPIDPLLGCTGNVDFGLPNKWPNGNWPGILADSMITDGVAVNVIVATMGVGGSYVADWAVGGSNNPRIGVMANRLTVAGLSPSAVLYCQGESDNGHTSQAAYTTSGNSMISTCRGFWPTTPIFIAQMSYINSLTDSNVTAAQAALVNRSNGVWAGPNGDSLTGANRQSDNTHWSTTGGAAFAAAWKTALAAYGSPFV
ncbi:sialate O-acetylesterase [Bradyrhizobium oligotrophicum]|uniref:sialate O-acetylesterase n=1 Tax=Bradyrhizobium oligotrophicum TaxID=44255 RepID=UPI003EBF1A54